MSGAPSAGPTAAGTSMTQPKRISGSVEGGKCRCERTVMVRLAELPIVVAPSAPLTDQMTGWRGDISAAVGVATRVSAASAAAHMHRQHSSDDRADAPRSSDERRTRNELAARAEADAVVAARAAVPAAMATGSADGRGGSAATRHDATRNAADGLGVVEGVAAIGP